VFNSLAGWTSLFTALGLGLLIGVVRERRHTPDVSKAGTRTHALLAVLGWVASSLGPVVFAAVVLVVGALALVGYTRTAAHDPGLTGEVALLVTLVLASLARQDATLAAALGVTVATLLQAKQPIQRLSREWITERELQDALVLAAAALVVMPWLPSAALDPWGVLHAATLWRIVVLVMAVGMLGHVAQRTLGARWGLPIAGFFSGFASSTAAVASFGRRARDDGSTVLPSAAAALLSNLASLLLLAGVIAAASPALLPQVAGPLAAAALGLLAVAVYSLRAGAHSAAAQQSLPIAMAEPAAPAVPMPAATPVALAEQTPGAFKLTHALGLAALIAAVSLLAAWLRVVAGDAGVLVAAVLVALAEVHAAAASIAQLSASGGMGTSTAGWGLVAVLASSALAKAVLAWVSGGGRYGLRVGAGLVAMVLCAAGGMAWVTR
jgi:uncharacterized membrane protein (DUF4010 family)